MNGRRLGGPILIRLTKRLVRELDYRAVVEKRRRSDIIRLACASYLRNCEWNAPVKPGPYTPDLRPLLGDKLFTQVQVRLTQHYTKLLTERALQETKNLIENTADVFETKYVSRAAVVRRALEYYINKVPPDVNTYDPVEDPLPIRVPPPRTRKAKGRRSTSKHPRGSPKNKLWDTEVVPYEPPMPSPRPRPERRPTAGDESQVQDDSVPEILDDLLRD